MSHNWLLDDHLWSLENCRSRTKDDLIKRLREENKKLQQLQKQNEELKKRIKELNHNAELHRQGMEILAKTHHFIPKT